MAWDLQEAVAYYKKHGAPGDQTVLLALLREVQEAFDGIPASILPQLAQTLGAKESLLRAMIQRQPRLRLQDTHVLEICAGPNCGKRTELAALAEKLCAGKTDVTLKYVPCMRLCGKGPNLKWDGQLYSGAEEPLLRALLDKK